MGKLLRAMESTNEASGMFFSFWKKRIFLPKERWWCRIIWKHRADEVLLSYCFLLTRPSFLRTLSLPLASHHAGRRCPENLFCPSPAPPLRAQLLSLCMRQTSNTDIGLLAASHIWAMRAAGMSTLVQTHWAHFCGAGAHFYLLNTQILGWMYGWSSTHTNFD